MRCPFCRDRVVEVDYKDAARLTAFLTRRNGIKVRRGKLNKKGRLAPGAVSAASTSVRSRPR